MERIRELAQQEIDLEAGDIEELANTAEQLQVMADVSGSDVFIDCLCKGRLDQAVVVAQAKPNTARSLYSEYIVGQIILRDNEPGVFYSFSTGEYVTGTRAITRSVRKYGAHIYGSPVTLPGVAEVRRCRLFDSIIESQRTPQ